MRAREICTRAAGLITGDRRKAHGPKQQNHDCIAAVWNGILEARRVGGYPDKLDAVDVATLMEGLKIARRYSGGKHNDENYIDAAGYAAICGEMAAAAEEKND